MGFPAPVTIEHAYDDWCVAQLALAVGKQEEAEFFLQSFRNQLVKPKNNLRW